MKFYIVFDSASGAVLRSGNCPDADLEGQVRISGEAVIETDEGGKIAAQTGAMTHVETGDD